MIKQKGTEQGFPAQRLLYLLFFSYSLSTKLVSTMLEQSISSSNIFKSSLELEAASNAKDTAFKVLLISR